MEKFDSKAYTQAYVITNFLINTGELVIKQEILDTIEKRMDANYYFDLNDLKQEKILEDTQKILTAIYLECMADNKEREKINKYVNEIKKAILKDEYVEENQALITADLSGIKLLEKIKIKLNKLFQSKTIFWERNDF